MKNKVFLFLLVALFTCTLTSYSKTPKKHCWKPKYDNCIISNYSGNINISIKDDRSMPPKSIEKYSSENLINDLEEIIKNTFPKAQINFNDSSVADSSSFLCIHIITFEATFKYKLKARDLIISPLFTGGSSRWYGNTEYKVELKQQNKNNTETQSFTFKGEETAKNWNGNSSGKKALSASFKQATDNLLNSLALIYK